MDESQAISIESNNLATQAEKEPKANKINVVGLAMYGEKFTHFQKREELLETIPLFKEYYYQVKSADFHKKVTPMLREFNEVMCYPEGKAFHPTSSMVQHWRKKWDRDLMLRAKGLSVGFDPDISAATIELVKVRSESGEMVAPEESELEKGVRVLGGELVNDAMTMLKDDQEMPEILSESGLIRRRNYVVDVFANITKQLHGNATLQLKRSQETRENAGFLMSLLSKASSGELTDEQLGLLEGTTTVTVIPNAK